ncbi:LysM peptidoglycan-binding domain-containing protein [Rhodococcus sp. NPDC127528]|uniref:LysM peptidoglycan-binding domain-containing protein n=1 Tax=unclassified Rhodococcus (in: high G+C Gram-positive bacteria) TaxID=192944 RepID=UPI00363A7408
MLPSKRRNAVIGAALAAVTMTLSGCSSDADQAPAAASSTPQYVSPPESTTPNASTPMPFATPASNATSYTVQPGDTLSAIAIRHGIHLGALLQANGLNMDSIIYPGQVLTVSGMPGPDPSPNPNPGRPGTKTYTVQAGDGLSDVALRFGGDLGEILRLNGFTSVDTVIHPGQVLIVPDKPGVGPYYPGAGTTPPPVPGDTTCGQFSLGSTPFNLVAVSTQAGRVGCTEAFTVMEEFAATPGAPEKATNIRGWDCHPREYNFPECTKDGLLMFGAP